MLRSRKLEKLLNNTLDPALKRRAKWLIENLDPGDGDKILEVGCGDGYYLHLLSSLGYKLHLTGTDYDKRALGSARRNLKGKKIKLVYGDVLEKLPFRRNSFDKIIMSEVLEHLPDDSKGLQEVKRVLKKGGILVLSVPNSNYSFLWDPINWTLERLFGTHINSGYWAGIWNQHERLYSENKLRNLLKESGLVTHKIMCLTYWALPFSHYIINLGARILASKNGGNLVAGANKFESLDKRSWIIQVYKTVTQFIDTYNNNIESNSGVSLVAIAKKKF